MLYLRKQRLYTTRWMLWMLRDPVFFVEAAIIAGWWTAEIGRQPWVVYNVLATADGVSPTLETSSTWPSRSAMFIVLYAILLALFLFLLNHQSSRGLNPSKTSRPRTWRPCRTPSARSSATGSRRLERRARNDGG